uniref:Uncharacterized protein n=1 Tax=Arundo donax TaxID=35708 RepID=A0A0A9LTI0_ARUDO
MHLDQCIVCAQVRATSVPHHFTVRTNCCINFSSPVKTRDQCCVCNHIWLDPLQLHLLFQLHSLFQQPILHIC